MMIKNEWSYKSMMAEIKNKWGGCVTFTHIFQPLLAFWWNLTAFRFLKFVLVYRGIAGRHTSITFKLIITYFWSALLLMPSCSQPSWQVKKMCSVFKVTAMNYLVWSVCIYSCIMHTSLRKPKEGWATAICDWQVELLRQSHGNYQQVSGLSVWQHPWDDDRCRGINP